MMYRIQNDLVDMARLYRIHYDVQDTEQNDLVDMARLTMMYRIQNDLVDMARLTMT